MKLIKTADFLAEFEAATPSAAPAVILNICSNHNLRTFVCCRSKKLVSINIIFVPYPPW